MIDLLSKYLTLAVTIKCLYLPLVIFSFKVDVSPADLQHALYSIVGM